MEISTSDIKGKIMDDQKRIILIPVQVIEPIKKGEENEEDNKRNDTINNHPDGITRPDP